MTLQENLTALFAQLVERTGGNAKAAELLGVSRQQMSLYLNGKNKVTEDLVNRLGRHLGVVLDCHLHLIQKDYDKSFIGDEIAKLQDGIWDVFKKISDFETFQPLDSEDEIFYKKIGDFYEYLKTYSIQPDAPIVEYDSTGNMENITLPDGRVLTAEEFRELE